VTIARVRTDHGPQYSTVIKRISKHVARDPIDNNRYKFYRFINAIYYCREGLLMKKLALALSVSAAMMLPAAANDIDIVDLKIDIDDMEGQNISVFGSVHTAGGMSTLSDASLSFDMNPIFVDTDNLPREDKRFLLTECELGCDVTVHGRVAVIMFAPGIVATAIER